MNYKEEAKSMINNYLFFTGDKDRARQCALYTCELFIGRLADLEEDKHIQNDYIQIKKELFEV